MTLSRVAAMGIATVLAAITLPIGPAEAAMTPGPDRQPRPTICRPFRHAHAWSCIMERTPRKGHVDPKAERPVPGPVRGVER